MQKKGVVFDFDYTLGDSTKGIILSANYGLDRLGYARVDDNTIRHTIGLSLPETYKALTGDADLVKGKVFAQFFKEKADTVMVENTILFPDVPDTLAAIHDLGLATGIVTTKFHSRIEQIFSGAEKSALIDYIIGSDDVKEEKPNPEGLLKMIRLMNAAKEEILYVGDSLVDAKTAQRAEVAFVAVTTGTTSREQFYEYAPVAVIDRLCEVMDVIG